MSKKLITSLAITLGIIAVLFTILWIKFPDKNWQPWATLITTSVAIVFGIIGKHEGAKSNSDSNSIDPNNQRRTKYLNYLQNDITNKLTASIHNARFIDLGMQDSPNATYLPFVFQDNSTEEEFNNINEAFEHYNGRMLILGNPGSGKTTSMLHIAKGLSENALNDPNEPIPLILNLSRFKFDMKKSLFHFQPKDKDNNNSMSNSTEIERWIVSEFIRFPGINSGIASHWINEGKVAVFFDGLDEVDDLHRAKLVELLNRSFLNRYSSFILVCSRINEYLPFQEEKEKKLQIDGAVTLQPLNEEQIINYLEQTKSQGLIDALYTDDAIKEMAKTPLMLSMMSLAYGSSAPYELEANLSITERRHQLMESYVAKMLQRKERRDRNITFDENLDNDVPISSYKYAPEKINKHLGWLAVRMSVRMQTTFSRNQFYEFLTVSMDRDTNSSVWWVTSMTRGLFFLLVFSVVGTFYMPNVFFSSYSTPIFLVATIIGAVLFEWFKLRNPQKEKHNLRRIFRTIITISVFGFFVVGNAIPLLAESFMQLIPGSDQLSSMVIFSGLILSLLILMLLIADTDFEDISGEEIFPLIIVCIAVLLTLCVFGFSLYYLSELKHIQYFWYYVAGISMAINCISYCLLLFITSDNGESFFLNFIPVYIYLLIIGITWLGLTIDIKGTYLNVLIYFLFIGFFFINAYKFPFYSILVIAFGFLLGNSMLNQHGAVLGILFMILFVILIEILGDESSLGLPSKAWFLKITKSIKKRYVNITVLESRYFLSPVLLKVLGLFNYQPFLSKSFYSHCQDSLLLKYSESEIEFTHRMIRDYFSLRELQPNLHSGNSKVRYEAIRNLGYQGDAGIDALIEFSSDSSSEIRRAAIWGMGRVASPIVVNYIKLGLEDESADVRKEAIRSSKHPNIISDDYQKILSRMLHDKDHDVQFTCAKPLIDRSGFTNSESDFNSVAKVMKSNKKLTNLINANISDYKKRGYWVVKNSIMLAGNSKDSFFLNALIKVLADSEQTFRVIEALAEIGDQKAIEPLQKYMSHQDERVRHAALNAINEIKKQN